MIYKKFFSQITADNVEQRISLLKDCLKETSADIGFFEKAKSGEFVEDEKLKKLFLCINRKLNVQDEEGNIQVSYLKERLEKIISDASKRDEVVKKCMVESGSPEEKAFNLVKCLQPYLKQVKFLE